MVCRRRGRGQMMDAGLELRREKPLRLSAGQLVCRVKEQHRWRGAVVPQGGGGSELSADRKVFGPQAG